MNFIHNAEVESSVLGGVNAALLHSMSESLLGLHSRRRERRVAATGGGTSSSALQLSKGRCLVAGNCLRASAGGKSRRGDAKATVKLGRASSRGGLGRDLGRRRVGCEGVVRVDRTGGDVGVGGSAGGWCASTSSTRGSRSVGRSGSAGICLGCGTGINVGWGQRTVAVLD